MARGSGRIETEGSGARRREMVGILLLAVALFVALSVGSLQLGSGTLMGPCGAFVGLTMYALVGIGSYLAALAVGRAAVGLLRGRDVGVRWGLFAACVGAVVSGAVLLHLGCARYRLHGYAPGGLVGEYGAELLVAALGTAGALLLGVTGLLLSLVATTPLTMRGLARAARVIGRGVTGALRRVARAAFPSRARRPSLDDADFGAVPVQPPARDDADFGAVPVQPPARIDGDTAQLADNLDKIRLAPVIVAPGPDPSMVPAAARARRRRAALAAAAAGDPAGAPPVVPSATGAPSPAPALAGAVDPAAPALAQSLVAAPADAVVAPRADAGPLVAASGREGEPPPEVTIAPAGGRAAAAPTPPTVAPIVAERPAVSGRRASPAPLAVATDGDRTDPTVAGIPELADLGVTEKGGPPPAIFAPPARRPSTAPAASPAAPDVAPRVPTGPRPDFILLGDDDYQLPDPSLLDFDDPGHGDLDRQAMLDLAGRLERTLADYGVRGRVSEIHPGPVVTMYEFVPQAGTKLSKITALSNDLAMALEALKVRIVAPIPGKAAVGIEVPNKVRETVFLKEIVADESFARSKSMLTLALGKDIAGRPLCVDLAKMPHLLVAGTTGSGKSVSVNGMICSLLFKASPDEVKLLMIDPKMLELSIYEGIPHLLLPVVTDPKKANLALRWAVDEMERRYDLISKSGVRDLASYNKKVEKQLERLGEAPAAPERVTVTVTGPDGVERQVDVETLESDGGISQEVLDDISAARVAMQQKNAAAQQERPRPLPYIVVIIDEFADLMMVASKEVETSVARIAQKARAAGIHLLLATQRPSVDVITGLIKANFPSRIAFQVAQKVDARTILDQQGAENLLGMGDMLFMDRGAALKRVHGALVTDVEIHRLVEFLKAQGKPVYDMDILKPRADEEGEDGAPEEDMSDEMYDQAVALVAETRQASISMIQRRLRIGYNRAARMVERMEREGLVGPADGARPREVLVSHHAA